MAIIQTGTAKSNAKSAEYFISQFGTVDHIAMRRLWELCEDCFAGETSVKAKDDKYILKPKSKQGSDKDTLTSWENYKHRGKFPDIPAKELKKATGIITKHQPEIVLEGKAARLSYMIENATPMRDGLDSLYRRTVDNVLRYGRYCLLLEPDENSERGFHINEFRPKKFLRAVPVEGDGESYAKLVILDTSSIEYDYTRWEDVYCPQITILALSAEGIYYQAKFGTNKIAVSNEKGELQYRDKEEYGAAITAIKSGIENFNIDYPDETLASELIVPDKFGKTLNRIPFTCINADDLNFSRFSRPPLLGQCIKCLHILNADCDHQNAIHLTTDPVAKAQGVAEDDVNLSVDRILFLPEGADFGYAGAPTDGLAIQAQNIAKMTEDAKNEGVFVAGMESAANVSGYALEIIRNGQTADLRTIAHSCGKGIEEQLRTAGKWLGMNTQEISENIRFTPDLNFAEVEETAQGLVQIANSVDKLELTRKEMRKLSEKHLKLEPLAWEDYLREKDEEADLDELGDVTITDFPPVVPVADDDNDKKTEETNELTDAEEK